METARYRVRLLNTRVVVRVAEAGIRMGQNILTEHANLDTPQTSLDHDLLVRLRRDLQKLQRIASEQSVDNATADVISQFQLVVAAVEKALHSRSSQNPAVSDVYLRDVVEDELEGAARAVDDSPWLGDQPEPQTSTPTDDNDLVGNVRRRVIERGNDLKRRATHVGAGIEEKIAEFVKPDGSIDVEGVKSYLGNVLDNAGMTWQRLNGIVPDAEARKPGEALEVLSASLDVRDSEKEYRLREEIGNLEKELIASSRQRETMLRNEDQLGKLIRAREIRQMDDGVSALRRTLAVRVLQLEMEKIFVSVASEIENSDYDIMMDQRVLVAEFGDLDSRLAALELFIDEEEPLLMEDDSLGELAADIQDLKTRLGIDDPLYSSATLNWAQLRQFFDSSVRKTRAGAEFYSRGLRLFVGDLKFATRLIRRAITGYTPSPREIRTLRRTGKDLLTLIPFTIVLVAPLTPVGHVLIFSFLQRYWPEFFPSTFSERRQSVMKRHEQYQRLIQVEADGKENVSKNGISTSDASRKHKPGPLAAVRRIIFFGVMGNEGTEAEKAGTNLEGGNLADTRSKSPDDSVMDEGSMSGSLDETDLHPLALKDIADSVRNNEKVAKKKRISVALDDLHLAD